MPESYNQRFRLVRRRLAQRATDDYVGRSNQFEMLVRRRQIVNHVDVHSRLELLAQHGRSSRRHPSQQDNSHVISSPVILLRARTVENA